MGVRWMVIATVSVLALGLLACGGDSEDEPVENGATSTGAATNPAVSPTGAPTGSAGSELQGEWHTTVSAGDEVTLAFKNTRYSIRRGPASGSGAVRIGSEQIEFFGSDLCDGTGVYRWSLEQGVLTFEEVVDDPCSGRAEVLVGQEYARD